MDSNTVIVGLTRNQPIYLKPFLRILLIVTGAVIAPAAYADTIQLKPDLPAARLAQIEAQMAPARFFTVKPFNRSFPTIRGRIIAVEPSPDHSQWVLKVRAWWRAVPNERVKWSSGLVALPREVVSSIVLEFDSLFGLRFALSDRDLTSPPMALDDWFERMSRAFDPDGRLGLAPEGSAPESAAELASVKMESGLLKHLRDSINLRKLTPVELQAESKKLANPLYWKIHDYHTLAQKILYAIAFDAVNGGIEPGYRRSAEKALAFLSYLGRVNVREEFRFGKYDLNDPSLSEVPESERFAGAVNGSGYHAYARIYETLQLGLAEVEIPTGGAGTPAAAQIGVEPSEVAFAALEVIEREPALWLLHGDDEARRTMAVQFLVTISELGAPAWANSPLLPAARRSDRQQLAPTPGAWSPLQVQARKTALRLLLPEYDARFIERTKSRGLLRVSEGVYQREFCNLLALHEASDQGLAIAQFVERILIETAKVEPAARRRPLAIPCLDQLVSNMTGAHSGNPTDEIYALRRRQNLPSLLIVGALFSGPGAPFPGTDAGKQFDKQMSVILDGLRDNQANFTDWDLMSHVCTIGGYVNETRRDWDDASAREALRQAVKAVRTIILNNDGDATQLKVRELVEKRTPRVRPLLPR